MGTLAIGSRYFFEISVPRTPAKKSFPTKLLTLRFPRVDIRRLYDIGLDFLCGRGVALIKTKAPCPRTNSFRSLNAPSKSRFSQVVRKKSSYKRAGAKYEKLLSKSCSRAQFNIKLKQQPSFFFYLYKYRHQQAFVLNYVINYGNWIY